MIYSDTIFGVAVGFDSLDPTYHRL